MKEPIDRSHETNTTTTEFQKQIGAITGRELTPENINTYASEALEDLVVIVSDVTSSYDMQPTIIQNGVEHERAAFRYNGLDPNYIETMLSHIADTAEDIERIGMLARELIVYGETVIMPPDSSTAKLAAGDGSFEQKKLIPRLQTIMLILEKNFGIDLKDQEQFRLIPGTVTKDMVRKTPYNVLDIPALNRIVDVCDEEGNRSFVFDRTKLKECDIDADRLKAMTKDELKELLETHGDVGRDFVYDENMFVKQITQFLNNIDSSNRQPEEGVNYADRLLFPAADESIVSANRIRNILNDLYGSSIDHKTVYKITAQLASEGLVRNQQYRFGPKRVTHGYTIEEFECIHERLGDRGLLYIRAAPEDISFPNGVADRLGVTPETVYKLADKCDIDVNRMPYRRFVSATARACSQSDVDALLDHLVANPLRAKSQPSLKHERLHFLSKDELVAAVATAANFGAVNTICEDLGINRKQIVSADEDVILVIREEALRRGFSYPPEGNMSAPMIAEESAGLRYKDVNKAIASLGDSLGVVEKHIYGPRPYPSYSPDQIHQIISCVQEYADSRAPDVADDRFTMSAIANRLGISDSFARKVLEGEPFETQFNGTREIPTYDEATVNRLEVDERILKNQNAQPAPESVQAKITFAREWHVSPYTVEKVARKYHMPLGTFRFGQAQIQDGYFEHDRDFLHNALEAEHYFAPEVGEHEYTLRTAAPAVGLASSMTVEKVVKILEESDESFGKLEWRKSSGNRVQVLNEEQLLMVDKYVTENNMRRGKKR